MKHVVVAVGLMAAAGCDSPEDKPDPGPGPRIRLTAQVAKTTPDQGALDRTLEYRPITPAPAVELGLVGEALEPAVYDEADGTVEYPADFVGQRWSLVYTLAGAVPREVQWSPPSRESRPHLVEPLLGRLERTPVPVGGGYAITPVGTRPQHTQTRVFTTGIWTEGVSGALAGGTFSYDFAANAVSLSGPRGAPEEARLDHAVLAHFVPSMPMASVSCRSAVAAATFVVPDLAPNSLTAPDMQPVYYGADESVSLRLTGPLPIDSRLRSLLGTRAAPTHLSRMSFGYVPSTDVPGFSRLPSEPVPDFFLPGPVMLAFASCTFPQGTQAIQVPAVADPPELRSLFPQVVHVEIASQRTRNAATLTSGFSAVVASSNYDFMADFPVAAPTQVTLQRAGAPIADLDQDADGAVLPAGEGPLELTFDVEPDAALAADYFDITLYEFQSTTLVKQRVYTVTDRKLTFDPASLRRGTEHVFEIRAYRGRPQAGSGNFALATYPQYAATIFTRTFRTPP